MVDSKKALDNAVSLYLQCRKEWDVFTLFVMSLTSSLLILVISVPRMIGDLVIAQIAKCVRSSAGVKAPLARIFISISTHSFADRHGSCFTYHHVKVVVATGLGVLKDRRSLVGNANNVLPFTPVVDAHAPHVSDRSTPGPDLIPAPVAKRVEDIPSCVAEHVSHQLVARSRARTLVVRAGLDVGCVACVALCVAVVVLPVVNAPAGKELGILLLVTLTSGVTSASLYTSVTVEAELETHVVDLVNDGLDTSWPLVWVRNKVALRITLLRRPAIIDVDVLVTGILQAKSDEGLSRVKGDFLAGCVALSLVLFTMLVSSKSIFNWFNLPNHSIPKLEACQLLVLPESFALEGQ